MHHIILYQGSDLRRRHLLDQTKITAIGICHPIVSPLIIYDMKGSSLYIEIRLITFYSDQYRRMIPAHAPFWVSLRKTKGIRIFYRTVLHVHLHQFLSGQDYVPDLKTAKDNLCRPYHPPRSTSGPSSKVHSFPYTVISVTNSLRQNYPSLPPTPGARSNYFSNVREINKESVAPTTYLIRQALE